MNLNAKGKSPGRLIARAIIMLVFWAIGLPLIIFGITSNIAILFVGLCFCGLPFGIAFYAIGKRREDNESVAVYNVSSDGSYYRVGGWKKFLLAVLGMALGVVATPVMAIYYFVYASKGSEAEITNYCKMRLSEIRGLSEKDIIIAASMIAKPKKDTIDSFMREYPKNVEEVNTMLPDLPLSTICFGLLKSSAERKKQFFENFPVNVENIKKKYPGLSVNQIFLLLMSPEERESEIANRYLSAKK